MAKENKTQTTKADPLAFLNSIEDAGKRADCLRISQWMSEIAGAEPVLWGPSILGYGNTRYEYESGRSGDWFAVGFSPRKQNITLYIMGGFKEDDPLLKQLGKYKTGKSCLYINKLADVEEQVLKQLIRRSVEIMQPRQDK